jgi:hypothetical protein
MPSHSHDDVSAQATPIDASESYFAAYAEHARTLRTWLVAYGIGAPVVILSQERIWERLATSGDVKQIALCFLVGVATQVVLSAVNKAAMWACYFGEIEPKYKGTWRYRTGVWLSERFSIDLYLDVFAMLLFGWATYRTFLAVT